MYNNSSNRDPQFMPANKTRGAGGVAGLFLILLGIAFFLQSQGYNTFRLNNWWALFILVPALGAFERAGQGFRSSGNRLNRSAGGSLLAGFLLALIALAFLFNLNWAVLGPLLIILAGLGILINSSLPAQVSPVEKR